MDYIKLRNEFEAVLRGERDDRFASLVKTIHCMSTPRVYALLNAIVSSMDEGENYVEVGTYQGGSLISALTSNNARAIGVDNFAEFSTTNSYDRTRANLERFGVLDRVTLHNMGYEQFFAQIPSDFVMQIYYYDGAHDYETQLAGLEAGWPYLRPGSIVIVDDYSYPPVVNSLNQFVENHKEHLKYLFVMSTFGDHEDCHPLYWNGFVALRVI